MQLRESMILCHYLMGTYNRHECKEPSNDYKIKVMVEVVESDNQIENTPQEQKDDNFTMIVDEKDAISIDNSEKAL
jgi:hypothetical protein